jgi:hypothetical protein
MSQSALVNAGLVEEVTADSLLPAGKPPAGRLREGGQLSSVMS